MKKYIPGITISIIVCLMSISLLRSQGNIHSSDIGLNFGSFGIAGDVENSVFPGYGVGLHYRTSINHAFSIRPEIFYGITSGLNPMPSGSSLLNEPIIFAGYSAENPWFYSYQTRFFRASVQGILELTNLGYSNNLKNYNIYLIAGLGINSHGTWLDLKNGSGQNYSGLLELTSYGNENDFNTIEGRRKIKSVLQSTYDGSYETPGPKLEGEFRLGNETNISSELSLGVGISKKLSAKFNISLEHEVFISNNDYLDGKRWRTELDVTTQIDLAHYTNIRLSYNLHVPIKAEPQYWINPWLEKQELIDSLGNRITKLEESLLDGDKDGVIDGIDQQSNSIANCAVDAKGVTLDSDKDGISDCYDKFPFGDKSEIEDIVADYIRSQSLPGQSTLKEKIIDTTATNARIKRMSNKNTLLPIIFFDTDSYQVSIDQYPALALLADFLKEHKIECLSATGHADNTSSNEYNQNLGVQRSTEVIRILKEEFGIYSVKFQAETKGEDSLLIIKPKSSGYQVINRRVEFKLCD